MSAPYTPETRRDPSPLPGPASQNSAYGGKLSQADVVLYHLATHALQSNMFGNPGNDAAIQAIKASPKVGAIVAHVASLPGVAAWEAGRVGRAELNF